MKQDGRIHLQTPLQPDLNGKKVPSPSYRFPSIYFGFPMWLLRPTRPVVI